MGCVWKSDRPRCFLIKGAGCFPIKGARCFLIKGAGPIDFGGSEPIAALVSDSESAITAESLPVQLAKHLVGFNRNAETLVMSGHLGIEMRFSNGWRRNMKDVSHVWI